MNPDLELGEDGAFYVRRKASKREIENYHRVQNLLLLRAADRPTASVGPSATKHTFNDDDDDRNRNNNNNRRNYNYKRARPGKVMSGAVAGRGGAHNNNNNNNNSNQNYQYKRAAVVPGKVMGAASAQSERQDQDKRPEALAYKHPPFFITFISIFQLVAFLYYALRSDEPLTLIGPVPFQSKLIYNPYRRYELWRFLTYMFIHAGYWHIAFNLLIQLAVGIPLELAHKFEPVFVIYLGGIIGGALGNSLADPHTYLAGASSGCYALIAAHLSNLIINWTEIRGACCRLFTLLVFSAWDLGTAVYERHFRLGLQPGRTSYGGHLAGALSGLLLGLIVLRNARVLHWELEAKKWAAGIYITLIVGAIVFNLANSDYFPLPDKRDLVWTANPFSFEREQ